MLIAAGISFQKAAGEDITVSRIAPKVSPLGWWGLSPGPPLEYPITVSGSGPDFGSPVMKVSSAAFLLSCRARFEENHLMISYLGDMPVAEAVFRAGASADAGNAWPLATWLFHFFGPGLVRVGSLCLSILLIGITGFRLGLRTWVVPFSTGVFLLTSYRDLGAGTLVSGSDPYLTSLLWTILVLSLAAAPSFLSAIILGMTILAWPALDISWTAAFFLTGGVLVGSCFAARANTKFLLIAFSMGLLGVLVSPPALAELKSWTAAMAEPGDSMLRFLTGWFSPNFQMRKELVLVIFAAACLARDRRAIVTVIFLTGVLTALLSEFGSLALSPIVAIILLESRKAMGSDELRSHGLQLAGTGIALVFLSLSGPKPMAYQRGVKALVPGLVEAKIRSDERKEPFVVFHDFRMAPQLIAAGFPSFLDARILSVGEGERNRRIETYVTLSKVANGFQETLSREQVNTILLPDEAPLVNLLRELGGYYQAAETQPLPFFFRGNLRNAPVVLLINGG